MTHPDWPDMKTGLNPYGLTYHLGLQGLGSDRQNPDGGGLEVFIALARELGACVLEIFNPWLETMSDDEVLALKVRLAELGMTPTISGGVITDDPEAVFRSARLLDAKTIRFTLSTVLCGDRAARDDWDEMVIAVRKAVRSIGDRAADNGIVAAIENHQDFTSEELVDFCGLSPGVGITFDMGNTFPVAEPPLEFTRTIAPHIRHLHLKDYQLQFTDEGFRLHRCAIGDGVVPFAEMFSIIGEHHETMTAALEPGALDARHVRLFTPGWWERYPPRPATQLAACLFAGHRHRIDEKVLHRTPWEAGEDHKLAAYELAMIRRSAQNMKQLGIL